MWLCWYAVFVFSPNMAVCIMGQHLYLGLICPQGIVPKTFIFNLLTEVCRDLNVVILFSVNSLSFAWSDLMDLLRCPPLQRLTKCINVELISLQTIWKVFFQDEWAATIASLRSLLMFFLLSLVLTHWHYYFYTGGHVCCWSIIKCI